MPEKSSRELIGELAMRIVFVYELHKPREVVAVQSRNIVSTEPFAILPQVRASPNFFDNFLGGCVVLFVPA